MQYEACNPVQNACEAVLGNGRVSLSFLQQPTALKPFDIEIRIENIDVDEVVLDFRMESMNMGINLYRLRQVADGLWKATVMLPVCTSRRSDWVGEVQVQHAGKIWFAEYRFGLLRE